MPLPACPITSHAAHLAEQIAQLVGGRQLLVVRPAPRADPWTLGGYLLGQRQLGESPRSRTCPRPGTLVSFQLIVRAVDRAQALVDVAQADAVAQRVARAAPRSSRARSSWTSMIVWAVADRRLLIVIPARRRPCGPGPVLDRVLDQRLEDHARPR